MTARPGRGQVREQTFPTLSRESCRSKRTPHNNNTVDDESRGPQKPSDKTIGRGADKLEQSTATHRSRESGLPEVLAEKRFMYERDVPDCPHCGFPSPVILVSYTSERVWYVSQ